MVFGVILAGGIGSRMGNVEKPKQYLTIGDKPIIIHTLEKFYANSKFEKLIVLCPSQWINHTKNLVKKNFKDTEKIVVIEGGPTRNETIMNSIRYIEKEYGLDDDTIIVSILFGISSSYSTVIWLFPSGNKIEFLSFFLTSDNF